MERFEVDSKITGLRNWVVPVPGSVVTAYLGRWDARPEKWVYSLWTGRDAHTGEADVDLIATDSITLPPEAVGTVSAEQIAKIAFLLEVDYADN